MTKKKKQTTKQQPPGQPGIIKPDFSELIAKLRTEQPEPEQEMDQPETITVTPAQVETPREQTDTGRAERLKRARELMQEQDSGSDGEVLDGIAYHDGSKQALAAAYPEETKTEALERVMDGETIVSVCKDLGMSRRTIQAWLAEYRELREEQSAANDLQQIDLIEDASKQILLSLDKSKLERATVRDLGIAYGILRDKLKDIRGPKTGTGNLRLRATFRGEGAIELTTGDQ